MIILPLVEHRDDAGAVDADVLPCGLGHVEVRARRVAPAAVVIGQRPVGRAEVGGSDGDGHAGLAANVRHVARAVNKTRDLAISIWTTMQR